MLADKLLGEGEEKQERRTSKAKYWESQGGGKTKKKHKNWKANARSGISATNVIRYK